MKTLEAFGLVIAVEALGVFFWLVGSGFETIEPTINTQGHSWTTVAMNNTGFLTWWTGTVAAIAIGIIALTATLHSLDGDE